MILNTELLSATTVTQVSQQSHLQLYPPNVTHWTIVPIW
uniref:Uncharacterized protein n=1 Tax=Anguilla anguilla TaxID=7936 RepID=A0A0E9SJ35_ANGAN